MAANTSIKDTDELRLSREQETRAAVEDIGPDGGWAPTPFTASPPAREGMEQRWIRVRLGGQIDIQNYLRQQQRGWRPRPADTLPSGYMLLKQNLEAQFGEQGSIIGNQDSILMERPLSLGNKVRAYYAKQTQRLKMQISEFIGDNMPRKHGTRGGSVAELEMNATVGDGRRPPIASD